MISLNDRIILWSSGQIFVTARREDLPQGEQSYDKGLALIRSRANACRGEAKPNLESASAWFVDITHS